MPPHLVEGHETLLPRVGALLARSVRGGAEVGEVAVEQRVGAAVGGDTDHQLVGVGAQLDVVLHRPVLGREKTQTHVQAATNVVYPSELLKLNEDRRKHIVLAFIFSLGIVH